MPSSEGVTCGNDDDDDVHQQLLGMSLNFLAPLCFKGSKAVTHYRGSCAFRLIPGVGAAFGTRVIAAWAAARRRHAHLLAEVVNIGLEELDEAWRGELPARGEAGVGSSATALA